LRREVVRARSDLGLLIDNHQKYEPNKLGSKVTDVVDKQTIVVVSTVGDETES
jgi:hypothetical protein